MTQEHDRRTESEVERAPKGVYYVASTSVHKIGAVEQALQSLDPNSEDIVEGVRTVSGVGEQPVSHEETLLGALNRLRDLEAKLAEKGISVEAYRGLVSIESGIYEVNGRWIDIAYVVIEEKGKIAIAPSAGVEFPLQYVKEAQRRGFTTTTVGSVMAEALQDTSIGTDPHRYLTNGRVTRNQLLQEAFVIAKQQLDHPASLRT